ncbi:hypothetical protein B0H11DRAFT_2268952 [Mycena galericulata]|nr:hypothetical protein B0H11DRAFT_2268952 [Mycena galericulata]
MSFCFNEAHRGWALFRSGEYQQAITKYIAALQADNDASPVLWSNLAMAYLKLEKFDLARWAAKDALMRDPGSIKARYRRAMAFKGLGLFPDCLLNLYSILAKSPAQAEARSLFVETISIYNSTVSKKMLSPVDILRADDPPAHGSVLTAPSTPHARISAPSRSIERASPAAALKEMACGACATLKTREDVAACSGCKIAVYCNRACQRVDWFVVYPSQYPSIPVIPLNGRCFRPNHKLVCSMIASNKLLLDLAEKLGREQNLRDLLTSYAIAALGLLIADPLPCRGILIIEVALAEATGRYTRRLSLRRITPAPAVILSPLVATSFETQCQKIISSSPPNTEVVGMLIYADTCAGAETFGTTFHGAVDAGNLAEYRKPGFEVGFHSHSFGEDRCLQLDLDVLFRAIEDEIEYDVDNYYGLRV